MGIDKQVFSARENIRMLSVLLSIILSGIIHSYSFAVTWTLSLLIVSNIRRINGKNPFMYLLRVSGYFIHLAFFYILLSSDYVTRDTRNNLFWGVVTVIIIFLYTLIHKSSFFFNLSNINIASMNINYSKSRYLTLIYNQFGAAICEELYFRSFIINFFNKLGVYSIFISALFFFLFHYTLIWGDNFKKNDFFEQFFIGLILATIYYYSHNILLVILIHSYINFPKAYILMKSYHKNYINPTFYSELLSKDIFDDLL